MKIRDRLRKAFKSLTLKVFLTVACVIIPLNIIMFLVSSYMIHRVEEQAQLSLQNAADVFMVTLDMKMQQADFFLYNSYHTNTNFVAWRKAQDEVEYTNMRIRWQQDMYENISTNSSCSAFFTYLTAEDDLLVTAGSYMSREPLQEYLQETIPESRKWTVETIAEKQYLVHITKMDEVYYGAFIDVDELLLKLQKSVNYNSGQIQFTSENIEEEDYPGYVTSISQSERGEVRLCIRVAEQEFRRNLSIWENGMLVVSVLCLFLLPLVYSAIRRLMLKPLEQLNIAHRELEMGNEDYRISEKSNSTEFEEAYGSFNQMADNIHSLKLENMEKELAKEKLQLNNLQLQIRPHFLFNTFNLIYNMTTEKDVDNVRELVLYMSNYFRHIFRSGKDLELFQKEQVLIEGYVKAAQIRYPDNLEIQYQIDPDVYMVRIPPLLIHNFIENIVNHALIKKQMMHIMLAAEYEDGMVTFIVSDDGKGMEAEIVESVNSGRILEEESKGERVYVGLRNAYARLRYFYGERAEITVESTPGEGTEFTIRFPYDLEEK